MHIYGQVLKPFSLTGHQWALNSKFNWFELAWLDSEARVEAEEGKMSKTKRGVIHMILAHSDQGMELATGIGVGWK
jgi:hypothetical protein